MPTDRIAQRYDAGPFPAADVQRFPPELVAQVERLLGRRFDVRLFETYERVRAFFDYQGVRITPELRAEQVLTAPEPARTVQTEAKPAPPLGASPAGRSIDPADLGD